MESAHELLTVYTCVFPGCPDDAKAARGPYAYCDRHRDRETRERLLANGGGDLNVAIAGVTGQPGGIAGAGDTRRTRLVPPPAQAPPPTQSPSAKQAATLSDRIKQLAGEAKRVDKLYAKATRLTAAAVKAKREADAAKRTLEQSLRDVGT